MAKLDPDRQRAFAIDVVRQLRALSFEAYWAGGCVRDQVMGREPKDYDVATAARPEQIRDLFGARRTVAIGEAFGVICVLGPRAAGQVEVATFRQDARYSDGRRPDSVEFTTPEADAERRDFTINGMFYDPIAERVIDYVGGQDDLARGIIRAIGEPRQRFAEDKLRLLRAVRFAAGFDFELDPATRDAVEAMAPQVTVVSVERIAAELRLMLLDASRVGAMSLLREVGLLTSILPELAVDDRPDGLTATGRPADTAWGVTLDTLAALPEPTFPLALAALLHAFVDPAGSEATCRRLKLSNHDVRRTCWLVQHRAALVDAEHTAWPKLQRLLTSDGIEELLSLHAAIAGATGKATSHVEYCRKKMELPPNELDPPPLVTGDDLIEHGVPRGRQYQRLLEAVRDAQLEKKIGSRREALALVDELQAATKNPKPKLD